LQQTFTNKEVLNVLYLKTVIVAKDCASS